MKSDFPAVGPAKIKSTLLDTVSGLDLGRLGLALLSAHSNQAGPTVWLTAGLHGDEVGGIVVIQEMFKRLKRRPLLRGSLHAFPLLNPIGFATASRLVTISEEDLNRCFPGRAGGTFGQRLADQIFRTIADSRPALVLDLHNDWTKSVPYTLIDPRPSQFSTTAYKKLQALAQQTGFVVIRDNSIVAGTLSASLLAQQIPALTLELGESYLVNERNIDVGVKAIWSTLTALNMVGADEPFHFPYKHKPRATLLTYSDLPAAAASGIVRFQAQPGEIVDRAQIIARIYSPLGRLRETLRAADHALLLGHTDYAAVFPGLAIMSFGVFPSA